MQCDKPEIPAPLHGGCCMYARPHKAKIITGKQFPILLFISRGLYDDESDPRALKIKKSIHSFQGLPHTKLLKPARH